MKKSRAGRAGWYIGMTAAAVTGAMLIACASSSHGAPATPSPVEEQPTSLPTSTNNGLPTSPIRWGYDPRRNNGQQDAQPHFEGLPPGYSIETYVSGIPNPTAIAFTPDGRMLVAEQSGAIRVVKKGVLQHEPFYKVPAYTPAGSEGFSELGLDGMTVDPGFAHNGFVYVYYSAKDPKQRTVLARIRDDHGRGKDLTEIFSLSAEPVCCHIGGSLRFAPDGTLFVAVGDHQLEAAAQDVGTPYGGVLRINPDGTAPAGNPFAGFAGADARRFAYGLRNPYDVAIDPKTGRIFATENGFVGQDAIVELKPGSNYGWPGSGLALPLSQIEKPLLFYNQAIGPSGIEFYHAKALPWLDGSLLFCQFHRGGALHRVTFSADGAVADDSIISTGCTSDVLTGTDGLVYFVDYLSGTIYRIGQGGS
jgi:glucose/arabinose dehydrogenase